MSELDGLRSASGDWIRRVQALEALYLEAEAFTACPLSATARTTVVYRGSLEPIVLFVGQSPGEDEDEKGEPFVGRSGEMLNEELAKEPFPAYAITNAILHYPVGNTFEESYAVACSPFLRRIVGIFDPKLLVPIGRDAQKAVLALGTPIPRFGIVHPSSVLHGGPRARWTGDFARLREWVRAKGY